MIRANGVVAALGTLLLLAGCAPGNPSSVTLAYAVDGEAREVTLIPEDVDCTEESVLAISIVDNPVGQFSFSGIGGEGRVRGGVEEGSEPGTLLFVNAESIDLAFATDGTLTVAATAVEVAIVADPDDPRNAVEVDGTLTAHLVCAPD